jgi:hypothetical protein
MTLSPLVVFSRDPGPTERLIAVVEALLAPPAGNEAAGLTALRREYANGSGKIDIVARPPAIAMWQAAGFSPVLWDGRDDAAAAHLLAATGAALVLTGTSDVDEPADRALWRAARAANIPSHAVLDQRVNLARRFDEPDGRVSYPDWIYVADENFAAAVSEIGVKLDHIRFLGDLHFERLTRRINALRDADLVQMRTVWGVLSGRKVILFVSEAVREMAAFGCPAPYDEIAELERLVQALEAATLSIAPGIPAGELCLVIRPHPRDREGKYDQYAGVRDSALVVTVSSAGELEAVIKTADFFVGMNSSLLHFAQATGKPALSLTGHPLGLELGATR